MTQGATEDYLPEVSLYFRPEDLTNQELGSLVLAQESEDDPKHAIHHGLVASQLWMSRNLNEELVKGTIKYDQSSLAVAADTLWQIYFPVFQRATGPALASAYIRALAQAKAGYVDDATIYALANEHAKRMGDYFHESSRDAMIDGFNTFVNRKVPARAAAEQALAGYGLTRKQMSGLAAMEPQKAVHSSLTRDIKAKVRAYITTSLRQRFKIFSLQEDHNLTQQADQFAWLWMVEKGKMDPRTEKVWFTAKDERVCPICGPMHGQAVPVGEKFTGPDGEKFWVPGVHVNCRCWVKTRVPRRALESVSKADDDWVPREHPRGGNPRNRGQFSRAPRKIVGVKERTTTNEGFDRIMRDLAARTIPVEEADEHVEVTPKEKTYEPVLTPKEPVMGRFVPVNWRDTNYTPVNAEPVAPAKVYEPVEPPKKEYTPVDAPSNYAPVNADPEITNYWTIHPGQYTPVEMPPLVKPETPKKPPRQPKLGVVRLDLPAYAVMGPKDMGLGSQFYFAHDKTFFEDKSEAIEGAAAQRRTAIMNEVSRHTQHWTAPYTYTAVDQIGRAPTRDIQAKLDPDQVHQVLLSMAAMDADEFSGDHFMVLPFTDTDGEPVGDLKVSVIELASHMGVEPGEFRYAVVEIQNVHESSRGHVQRQDPGTVSVSGYYEMDRPPETENPIEGTDQVEVFHLEPFDPEEFWVDDDDDWNE